MKYIASSIFILVLFTINAQLEFEKELEIINKTWNQKDVFYVKSTYTFWNDGSRTIKAFNQCSDDCSHEACFSKDCKCTTVNSPQQSIRPGASGSFTIIYEVDPSKSSDQTNVNTLKRGSYHKIVEIGVDDEHWYELELKGNVRLTN